MASILQTLERALAPMIKRAPVPADRGWTRLISTVREGFAGAWQRSVTYSLEDSLQYWAVFRCVSIISSDIAKMRVKLVEFTDDHIWQEVKPDKLGAVLKKPNPFQTRIQFFTNWMESKLTRGNTYVLKQRDAGGRVIGLRVLDPSRVIPLVADDGSVFYQLNRDNLGGINIDHVIVEASEIIHDRWNTFYHPLVGLSPIYACGINAAAGLKIQNNSYNLFANGARPGGILTAPGAISKETAERAKEYWENNYSGENAGKVAVLGDGLKYEHLTLNALEAAVIDQLKWDDATIAGCYGVPLYKLNSSAAPATNNVEALNTMYYTDCVQPHLEAIELLLDEGLELEQRDTRRTLGTEFDLDGLMRMDTATAIKTAVEGLKGLTTSNEARRKFDLPPVEGGDAVLVQQQNFSLEALAKRDAKADPFANGGVLVPVAENDDEPAEKAGRRLRIGAPMHRAMLTHDVLEPDDQDVTDVLSELRRGLGV